MTLNLFVNGTLMRGFELHENLKDAKFVGEFSTAPLYRLYSINDIHPGMFELEPGEHGGVSIAGEIYKLTEDIWSRVEAGEPPNLYKGPIKLLQGQSVDGILFPRSEAQKPENNYLDISHFGGWRPYIMSKR